MAIVNWNPPHRLLYHWSISISYLRLWAELFSFASARDMKFRKPKPRLHLGWRGQDVRPPHSSSHGGQEKIGRSRHLIPSDQCASLDNTRGRSTMDCYQQRWWEAILEGHVRWNCDWQYQGCYGMPPLCHSCGQEAEGRLLEAIRDYLPIKYFMEYFVRLRSGIKTRLQHDKRGGLLFWSFVSAPICY